MSSTPDPGSDRRPAPVQPRIMSAAETAALRTVQRRIVAIVFFAVAIHGVLGLVVVANIIEEQGRRGGAIVLVFMSAVLAVVVSVVVRVILAARPYGSWPWMLLALVPSAAGLYLVL